ncbi:MAG: hemerythrin domain-containing protein, partial [Actinomycetota bacterium]
ALADYDKALLAAPGFDAALLDSGAVLEILGRNAEAEERYFYPMLVRVGTGAADAPDVEEEVEDAVKDHNEIRHALRAVAAERVGTEAWWQAVTACNIANSDHMAEEERQDLTDFRRHASLEMRHEIAVSFLRYEALKAANGVVPEDKDPERYVKELEAKMRATT